MWNIFFNIFLLPYLTPQETLRGIFIYMIRFQSTLKKIPHTSCLLEQILISDTMFMEHSVFINELYFSIIPHCVVQWEILFFCDFRPNHSAIVELEYRVIRWFSLRLLELYETTTWWLRFKILRVFCYFTSFLWQNYLDVYNNWRKYLYIILQLFTNLMFQKCT